MFSSRNVIWVLACVLALGFAGSARAADKKEAAPAVSPEEARLQAEKKVRQSLNGTRWEIQLAPMAGENKKGPMQDMLKFEGGKISSEKLSAEGFPETNFSITIKSTGSAVWETMQTAPNGEVAFWQGQLAGENMRGILSRHTAKGDATDFAFGGKLKPAAPPPPPPVEKVETPAAANTVETPVKPAKKSTKKTKK